MDAGTLTIVVALGAGATVLLLGWALAGGDQERFDRRLARARQDAGARLPRKGAQPVSVRRASADSGIPVLDTLIKRLVPNPDKLRRRLARTGRSVTLGEYVLGTAVLTLLSVLVLKSGFGLPVPVAVPGGLALGIGLPHMVTGFLGARRTNRFLDLFPDAIDLIVRGVKSGLPVVESIMTVGRELPDPVGMEFRQVGDAVRMGRTLEEALWDVSARLDVPEFKFLVIAMSIQRETGGNLAETLSNLSQLLRRRRQLKLKIKALSSEARASAMIIGSLPFIMFALLSMLNPGYTLALLNDPRGLVMTGGALLMIGSGAFIMAKMVRFDV